jgi:hypothetical protein
VEKLTVSGERVSGRKQEIYRECSILETRIVISAHPRGGRITPVARFALTVHRPQQGVRISLADLV